MTRGWPDEEGRRRWRDTLLETRRFAGTLSIGVLATPAVNILPLTNPPGGPWVVLLTEKGQADRAQRADRARGWKKRENAGERAMAREGRSSEKGRRDARRGSRDWSRLRERRMEGLEGRGWRMLVHEGSSPLPTSSSSSFSSSPRRPAGCCVRGEVDGHYYPTKHPILSYPPDTILS